MKAKFKFSAGNKDEKANQTKEKSTVESESFNITELQKYYAEFTEKSKSNYNIKILLIII